MLVDLRAVVETALARNGKSAAAGEAPMARAHAAGAAATSEVPDFEVSMSSPDWSETNSAEQPDTDHNHSK